MFSKEYMDFREAMAKLPPPGSMPPDEPPPEGVYLFGGAFPIPEGVTVTRETLAGVPVEWSRVAGAPEDKLILYIHGGGFQPVPKGKYMDFPFGGELAARSGLNCVSPDYRLMPEGHFPDTIEDVAAVYTALLDMGYKAENIAVTGESAGGNLSLALWLWCRMYGIACPGAVAALSAAADLSGTEERIGAALAPGRDLTAPLLSPRYGDYRGMKRVFVQYGTEDIDGLLVGPGEDMIGDMRLQGVDVVYDKWPGLGHAFAADVGLYPEADEACQRAIDFLKKEINA